MISTLGFGSEKLDEKLGKLIAFARFTEGLIKIEAVMDDPTDDNYVECAVEGGTDLYYLRGTCPLTDLKHYHGIRIVAPAFF